MHNKTYQANKLKKEIEEKKNKKKSRVSPSYSIKKSSPCNKIEEKNLKMKKMLRVSSFQLHAEKLTQLILCEVLRVGKHEQTRPERALLDEIKGFELFISLNLNSHILLQVLFLCHI